jgi:Ca2+/Na+ antiporter
MLQNHNNQNNEIQKNEENGNIVMRFYRKTKEFIVYYYGLIFPDKTNSPVICFIVIIISTYIHTLLIINIIEDLSSIVQLTASFLGMTLISWSGNVGDTINAAIATKLRAADLLTTSILASQVMNLQICLGLPWVISILKNKYYGKDTFIDFGKRHPLKFLLPLYIVVLSSIFIMTIFRVNLNRKSGICLIVVYILYLLYEFDHNIN